MAAKPKFSGPQDIEVWSVSQLTRRVKSLLEHEIARVWVSGEISNFRVSPAGHAYFTLKDETSQLSCVMFKGKLSRLKFEPESGIEVMVNGLVTVYEQRGQYQIICDEMQPKGLGALQLAFERLKQKLQEEGLFDEERKKSLPLLPRRIGIVTSPTGAAIRDILNVLGRRFANVHVILYPARVQGDEAAAEIAEGIRTLDEWGVDVMIVGRGGGSLEDLWPFNEEVVVRAVFEARTPIVSAVGHEIDYALTDFAADLRAPTPSAAAEIVIQERETLVAKIDGLAGRMARAMGHQLESARSRLDVIQSSFVFQRPEELIRQRRQRADELRMNLERVVAGRIEMSRHRFDSARQAIGLLSPANQVRRSSDALHGLRQRLHRAAVTAGTRARARFEPLVAQLDALSPLAILSRGYAVAWKMPEEKLIRKAAQLKKDDKLRIRFGEGGATVTVDDATPEPPGVSGA